MTRIEKLQEILEFFINQSKQPFDLLNYNNDLKKLSSKIGQDFGKLLIELKLEHKFIQNSTKGTLEINDEGKNFHKEGGFPGQIQKAKEKEEFELRIKTRPLELAEDANRIALINSQETKRATVISLSACIFSAISLILSILTTQLQVLSKGLLIVGTVVILTILFLTQLSKRKQSRNE